MNFTSKSETHTQENGAIVEVGTISFQGRKFAALGSVVDVSSGYVQGYVHKLTSGSWELRSWGGETLAPLRLVRTWKQKSRGPWPIEMFSWSCTIKGVHFSGRNGGDCGAQSLVSLKARKR